MKELEVQVKSPSGNIVKTKKIEFEDKIQKLVVTVDTQHLINIGAPVDVVMANIAEKISGELKNETPVLIIPEWMKLQLLNTDGFKKEEDVKSKILKGGIICKD